MTEVAIDRRRLAAGLAVLIASGSTVRAQGHDHSHSAAAPSTATAPLKKPEQPSSLKAVVAAADRCEKRGTVCRAHCIRLIRKGDISLVECRRLVEAMLPVCAAVGKLASQNAPRFKDLAKVCLAVCADCEAECRKHAAHHAECKGCMEACQNMVSVLKGVLGA
ncbi:MAG: four-helix bundle copper-binding protein [Proteobacteria bacterium]|nr:four-helix bundle copper-binding protein [Pseudomonadota bacterium]